MASKIKNPFFTPPSSPRDPDISLCSSPESIPTSPISNLHGLLEAITPNRPNLNYREKNTLEKAKIQLEEKKTPEREEAIDKIKKTVIEKGHLKTASSAKKKLFVGMEEKTWAKDLFKDLNSVTDTQTIIVNLEHIVNPVSTETKNLGFHFCPENHPLRSQITDIVTNPFTGVWCGKYQSKFSTFFPADIKTEEELLALFATGKEIASKDNRSLLQVKTDKTTYCIEVYKRESGFVYYSAFPIFYYAEYDEDAIFTITDSIKLTAKDVLPKAISLLKNDPKALQYETKKSVIVNISSLIPDFAVEKGILISFPKKLLS